MLTIRIPRWCAWLLRQPSVGEQVEFTMVIVDDLQSGGQLLTEESVDAVLMIGEDPGAEPIAGGESCDEILCWFLLITKSPELWQLATDVGAREVHDVGEVGDCKVFCFEGYPLDLPAYEPTIRIEDRRVSKSAWEE